MRFSVRHYAAILVLLAATALPRSAAGQEPESTGGETRARTDLEAGVRFTSLRSEGAVFLGGSVRFDFGGPASFGAGGWALRDPVELTGGEPGTGLRLKMAYAGLATGIRFVNTRRVQGIFEMLWGVGNAKLELPAVQTEIAADNFLVLEPGVATHVRLVGPLHLTGEVAYRWTAGVEDLPGVSGDQLRGASLYLGVAIGPF